MGSEGSSVEINEGGLTALPANSVEGSKRKNPLWMAELYVARHKAKHAIGIVDDAEHLLDSLYYNKWDARRAAELGNEAETYMDQPDFENTRETNQAYQRLVEEFATLVGAHLIDRNQHVKDREIIRRRPMDHKYSIANIGANTQAYQRQAEKFEARADKIASEHNTPKEKIQYAMFAFKCSFREFIRAKNVDAVKPKFPRGAEQMFKEMEELDQQKGKYRFTLGDTTLSKTTSRLDALGARKVFGVVPISPTPPFLTGEPKNNVNATVYSVKSSPAATFRAEQPENK